MIPALALFFAGCPRGAGPPDYEGRPDAGGDADVDSDSDSDADTDTGDPCLDPGSVTLGAPDRLLLRGTVVTPDEVLPDSEVLVLGNEISCVGDCSGSPGADGATVIDTAGTIFPGLVDAHDHVEYDWMVPWETPRLYVNHDDWQGSAEYGEYIDPHRIHQDALECEMTKWGEIRALVGGTTTMQGAPQRRCIHWLVRNAEHYADLGVDRMRTNTLGIDTVDDADAATIRSQMDSGEVTAYVIHVAEGLDESARSEFDELVRKNLLAAATVVIHGTAFGDSEWARVGDAGAKLVWSPRSNLVLYGDTTDVPAARAAGVLVALGPDWTPSGSPSMPHEMRAADAHDDEAWGDVLSAEDLVRMATSDGARVLALDEWIGRIEPGLRADLTVVACGQDDPYRALVEASLGRIRMVLIDGVPLYGDAPLMAASPAPFCEPIEICTVPKLVCVKASEAPADLFDQTVGDVLSNLEGGGLSVWPLAQCLE